MKYIELIENEIKEKAFSQLRNYNKLRVADYINVSKKRLTSLDGSPEKVKNYFHCWGNSLTTLVGGPLEVGGAFMCSHNQLTNLVGSPEVVGGDFNCSYNPLSNLVGAPITVGGDFWCGGDNITDLRGITTKEISGCFVIFGKVVGILELFKIKGILKVQLMHMPDVETIINSHLPLGIRGMLQCQAEFIANGYKEYL